MTHKLFPAFILVFVLVGLGNAQGASFPESGDHLTKAQVKQLARDAHTKEEYSTLASYYGDQQNSYLQQATEAKKEWGRLSQNIQGAQAKYPSPVDSARNLYEYYMYKASEYEALEAKYSRLAAPDLTR